MCAPGEDRTHGLQIARLWVWLWDWRATYCATEAHVCKSYFVKLVLSFKTSPAAVVIWWVTHVEHPVGAADILGVLVGWAGRCVTRPARQLRPRRCGGAEENEIVLPTCSKYQKNKHKGHFNKRRDIALYVYSTVLAHHFEGFETRDKNIAMINQFLTSFLFVV